MASYLPHGRPFLMDAKFQHYWGRGFGACWTSRRVALCEDSSRENVSPIDYQS